MYNLTVAQGRPYPKDGQDKILMHAYYDGYSISSIPTDTTVTNWGHVDIYPQPTITWDANEPWLSKYNYTDYYYASMKQYVYCSQAVSVGTYFNSDDPGSFYVNGVKKAESNCTYTSFTLELNQGWNVIQSYWHENGGGSNGWICANTSSNAPINVKTLSDKILYAGFIEEWKTTPPYNGQEFDATCWLEAQNVYIKQNNSWIEAVGMFTKVNGEWSVAVQKESYDYGDGTLNMVQNGYANTLYVNNVLCTTDGATAWAGNYNLYHDPINEGDWINCYSVRSTPSGGNSNSLPILNGTNYYQFTTPVDGNSEKTVWITPEGGAYTTSCSVGGLKLRINGSDYTLEEAVTAKLIKPLVIIWAFYTHNSSTNNYYWANCLNLYNGGSTESKSYPKAWIICMTNKGSEIQGITLNANKSFSTQYNDGIYCRFINIEDKRFTVSQYQN